MKNKKNILFLQSLFVLMMLFVGQVVYAEDGGINFTIKNNGVDVFSGTVPLSPEGNVSINDTEGNTQEVNARSVLNVIKNADNLSSSFNISNLIYYSSFSAFYLKCINVNSGGELCDNWMYKVNGTSPDSGMDQNILSGGEDVVFFFGSDEAPEEDVPPEPEPEPEPAEASTGHSSSGSRPKSYVVTENIEEETEPAPVLAELPKTETIVEVPKTDPVVSVVKKNVPAKKIVEIKKPVVENTANVLNAVEPISSDAEQKGWLSRFFGWLFGF